MMRRNSTLCNSFDTNVISSEYSLRVSNERSDQSRNDTKSVEDAGAFDVQESTGRAKDFGETDENHGWIECTSRSLPGRTYYYNTWTCRSTWNRPTACAVRIPKYSFKPKNVATRSSCSLPLIAVSDEEEQIGQKNAAYGQYDSPVDYKFSEILSRLYHCPPLYSPRYQVKCDSKIRGSSRTDSKNVSVKENDGIDEMSFCDDTVSTDSDESSIFLATDFVQTQLDCIEAPKAKDRLSRLSVFSEKSILGSYEESAYSGGNEDDRGNYSVPRLKTIKPCDLSRDVLSQKERTRKRLKSKQSHRPSGGRHKEKSRKIVCQSYGIRTISYDVVRPESPRDVKKLSLSDTSDASSAKSDEKQTKGTILDAFTESDPTWNIVAPALSEATSC